MSKRLWIFLGTLLLAAFCAGACTRTAPSPTGPPPAGTEVDLAAALSAGGELSDWRLDGETEVYDKDTLFDLVNGQADAFYAYNFRQVAVQRYQGDSDETLRVEIWELATPHDAYGLFTRNTAGSTPAVGVGNDTDEDPGHRLAFWQDRYFVEARSFQPLAEGRIAEVATAIAHALPQGGEPPALIAALPEEDRTDERAVFFRLEISIQDEIWLGGENILGLGSHTAGVLARYEIAGTPAHLLVVQYASDADAAAALERLYEYDTPALAAAENRGPVLMALFGGLEPGAAQSWLQAVSISVP